MSNRIPTPHLQLPETLLPARHADAVAGVPMEASDRRTISIFAMFALDEPEDRPLGVSLSSIDEGICAFLPTACTGSWERSRR